MTSPTSRAGEGSCSGFTLVELLLVVILIGVLCVAAVPDLGRSYRHLEVEETARQLAALAQYGRERAILEETRYALHLDRETREAWLSREELDAHGLPKFREVRSPECRRSWPHTVSVVEVVANHESSEKFVVTHLCPDGSADSAVLAFANPEGEQCTVVISPTELIGKVVLSGDAE